MTRDEKIARARELRAEGLTIREIAVRVELPRASVHDALRGIEHVRARRIARSPECPRCGRPMTGFKPGRPTRLCGHCVQAAVDARVQRFVALWAERKTLREISIEIGWTYETTCVALDYYRKRGHDLPYRHSPQAVRNIRAGIANYWDRTAA